MLQDFRHAVRRLSATPIVTVAAVLSLALGIGANTALFSLLNGLVFKRLPVADPDRLELLTEEGQDTSWSGPIWEQLQEHQELVDGAFAWFPPRLNLVAGGQTQVVDAIFASGRFFDVLGVLPDLGRAFTEADDRRDGGPDGPVAVVSHDFWRRHFGGSQDALGSRLVLDRVTYTVVGVAPRGFFGPDVGRSFDVALPLRTWSLVRGPANFLEERNSRVLRVMVRVKRQQTQETAAIALNSIRPLIKQATLPSNMSAAELARYLTRPFALRPAATGDSRVRGGYQRPLTMLLVIAAFVLLIACSNIANLLLARVTGRRQEITIMRALGASQWRVARQYLAESLMLAGAGTAIGLLFAQWTSGVLVHQLSTPSSTVSLDLTLDWRMLAFTIAIGVATAVSFGVAPALHAVRAAPATSIRGRGAVPDSRLRMGGALVVTQVAISLTLVVAAGLFLRTFVELTSVPLGFESNRLLIASIDSSPALTKSDGFPGTYAQLRESVLRISGVESAALSRLLPVGSGESSTSFFLDTDAAGSARRSANTHEVSPDFFATLRIPMVLGRDITVRDRQGSPRVAVINQAFVRAFLESTNPIGRRILQPGMQPGVTEPLVAEIVGVVGDTVYRVLRNPAPPTIYFALEQRAQPSSIFLHVRGTGEPLMFTRTVAAAVNHVNSEMTVRFTTMDDQLDAALARERLLAMLTGFFGVLGVLLAAIGLFGVTSYGVSLRRAELSVRLALGASGGRIMHLVFKRVALLVTTGVVCGTVLTWWLAQFINVTLLYGVQPRDLPTIAGAAFLLIAVALFAGWWPARRATRFDPAPLLRET